MKRLNSGDTFEKLIGRIRDNDNNLNRVMKNTKRRTTAIATKLLLGGNTFYLFMIVVN